MTKICKIILGISSVITYSYGLFNLVSYILMNAFPWDKVGVFIEGMLTFHLLTWPFFGVFAVATLLSKIYLLTKFEKECSYLKFLKIDISLHILFSVISVINIVALFDRAF